MQSGLQHNVSELFEAPGLVKPFTIISSPLTILTFVMTPCSTASLITAMYGTKRPSSTRLVLYIDLNKLLESVTIITGTLSI